MNHDLEAALIHFVRQEQLPEVYLNTIRDHIEPLAQWIRSRQQNRPQLIGINGCQGSGKSTLSGALAILLRQYGLRVAVLSLDDFYLTRFQRQQLAARVHPLLQTRGVPGTHDMDLAAEVIGQLMSGGHAVSVPRFDKRVDDRCGRDGWTRYDSLVDIILLEGWCVATPAQTQKELNVPINELEMRDDADGRWRHFVNEQLADSYRPVFDQIDALIFLQAPGFDSVFQWRKKQERRTFQSQKASAMSDAQLTRFIQHFERLSRAASEQLPEIADVVVELDEGQGIRCVNYRLFS